MGPLAGVQGSIFVDGPSTTVVGQLARHVIAVPRATLPAAPIVVKKMDKSVDKLLKVLEEANRSRSEDLSYLHRWVTRR